MHKLPATPDTSFNKQVTFLTSCCFSPGTDRAHLHEADFSKQAGGENTAGQSGGCWGAGVPASPPGGLGLAGGARTQVLSGDSSAAVWTSY